MFASLRAVFGRAAELLLVLSGAACTALGPMPAATGVAPLPVSRPGAELQLGGVPGYYLSSSVAQKVRGTSIPQVALLFEPDELIGVPGLVVGGRYVGDEDSGQ